MSNDRRRYQHEVARLLEAIRLAVTDLYRLRARGIGGRGLADHENELSKLRNNLATLISARFDQTQVHATPSC
jgi:hypothetical protein